jgi:hypothetical protein
MVDAFAGIYLINLDVDEWGWGIPETGYYTQSIPMFFGVDQDARPNGLVIGGDAWGENIPVNMAPPLKEFFALP